MRGSPGLGARLVLLYEREKFLDSRPAKSVARSIAVQAQKISGGTRQSQHDAVAIEDENMTVRAVRRGDNFKLPTIERMGGIGYLDRWAVIADTFRVVERGVNTGYPWSGFPKTFF
jgi:hypothetical protein